MAHWSVRPAHKRPHLPAGFIGPCLPSLHERVPRGPAWQHEVKWDGYRILARKLGPEVRLWSRNGQDWTPALDAIREAVRALPDKDLLLDGEAVAHDAEGLPDFHRMRSTAGARRAVFYAFDLIRRAGLNLQARPLSERRAGLAEVLVDPPEGIRLSDAFDDGERLFAHACAMGLEGIVSKRRDSRYVSGRSRHWLKVKCEGYLRRGEPAWGPE
jgi:bifunctional non-homologous end joining protein LigD